MREHGFVALISLLDAGVLIDGDLAEQDVIVNVLVGFRSCAVLIFKLDRVVLMLLHDLLDTLFQKAVERRYLLGHESVQFEVRADDSPGVLLVDLRVLEVDWLLRVLSLHIY